MRVILAGYNLDSSTIEKAKRGEDISGMPLTPETIAVAYARISRDPSPVSELRRKAVGDVEAARRSARSIVFEMNHQSVAEHAVFNFDVLDVSRLCAEALERHRLCSYTEKSQRYQELGGDFHLPEEFEGEAAILFEGTMKKQYELYSGAYGVLLDYFKEKHPRMMKRKGDRRILEGYAKEDARYAVGLATRAQLGFSANARNLEYVIRCLRAHPLREARNLGEEFYRLAGAVAPSLILLTDPAEYEKEFGRPLSEDHFKKTRPHGREIAGDALNRYGGETGQGGAEVASRGDVKLIDWTPEPDKVTVQAILHSHTLAPFETCRVTAGKLVESGEAEGFIREFLKYANPWESATREFEVADFTFEVVLSSACYGQMKRHRMCTQLVQRYDPDLGCTYPSSVVETGLKEEFADLYEITAAAYHELSRYHPEAAQYVLANGHRRRMIVKANARELYHISRLREDAHAQWDIRQVGADMLALAREKAPLTLMLARGKDSFPSRKKEIYG